MIENHNLHGFDLPFLDRRARRLGVAARPGPDRLRACGSGSARRGIESEGDGDSRRRVRFVAPGRELIDTLDAVLRHDFSTRALPDHGLKAVARHLGIAGPEREHIPGDRIYEVYRRRPGARAALRRCGRRGGRGARADARRRRVRARPDGAATLRAARRCRRGDRRDRSAARPRVPARRDGAARAPAGRRHAAQRRGAAPVRVRRRAARGQGRRREPVPVADARVPDRPGARSAGRDARARRSARRAAARGEGQRPRGAGRIRRAPHARSDVGGDEARRQLGVRLPRGGRQPDALRRRPRRERGDAPRPRDARADVPRARRSAA